jgi:Cu-processing system permease protein
VSRNATHGVTVARVRLVARRELRIQARSRGNVASVVLLFLIAWLPPLLLSLRAGTFGLASFSQVTPLAIALGGIVLPLLGLWVGTELLAGELERGSLCQLLSLPISRRSLLIGKWLGAGGPFVATYVVAFASVGAAIAVTHGTAGANDYLATAASGLLLATASLGIGTFIGAAGISRTRALGVALGTWVILVFAVDAVILGVVVAIAPPPPTNVGHGGHTELAPPHHTQGQHEAHGAVPPSRQPVDTHAHGHGGDTAEEEAEQLPWPAWLMLLDPVDLFRLSVLSTSQSGRTRFLLGLSSNSHGAWFPIGLGWAAWLLLPYGLAIRRFARVAIRTSTS